MKSLDRLEELTVKLEAEELAENVQLSIEDLIAVLDFCLDGWWIYNIETGYDYLSKKWCTMLGYTQAELDPHLSTWLKLIHPEDKEKAEKALKAHIETGVPYKLTARYKHKNGKWVTMHDVGTVIRRNENNEAIIVAGYESLRRERCQKITHGLSGGDTFLKN